MVRNLCAHQHKAVGVHSTPMHISTGGQISPLVLVSTGCEVEVPSLVHISAVRREKQPMCDPEGCATVLGVIPPPFVDPNLGGRQVGQSARPAGLPWGGGGGVPQHTYLKIIPMTR